MKKDSSLFAFPFSLLLSITFYLLSSFCTSAQNAGWPSQHKGVMLQGFYWDSFDATKWSNLESQADELADYFTLVWIPQSANCGGLSMGYDDLYWFSNYNSSFGNETELRSLISTLKSKGVGTIADVVINHRKTLTNWVDFPTETYNGKTYQLKSTDICANDDGGATLNWAQSNGYSLSNNGDSGEDWGGMRDLDHTSTNVQHNVKAYLDMLLNDFQYAGFRYDMVKGYAGKYTGLYNSHANPTYSVGEYWDGNAGTVKTWLNSTKVDGQIQSAAFDFPFRYSVRDAANNGDWTKLAGGGLATDKDFQRYAVTFVENHDTEYRSAQSQNDPIRKDTIAANAYMLAMPGTPCVFLKHWTDCKRDIKNMILVRNLVGISNQSSHLQYASNKDYYAVVTTGENGKLLVVVGKGADTFKASGTWQLALKGYHYAYYLEAAAETVCTDLPSGTYDKSQTVTLRAVSATSGAKIVYTLDGTQPTASSTSVANGSSLTIPAGTHTLKAGLLVGGAVTGVITRHYTITNFQPYDITVYVNTDNAGWTNVNFWTWGGDGTHGAANSNWPGDKVSTTVSVGGKNWYAKTYHINSSTDFVNFVFSTNSGSPQTIDIENITQDTFFYISTTLQGGKNTVTIDEELTSIEDVRMDEEWMRQNAPVHVYSIGGQLIKIYPAGTSIYKIAAQLPPGIHIVNGKKIMK